MQYFLDSAARLICLPRVSMSLEPSFRWCWFWIGAAPAGWDANAAVFFCFFCTCCNTNLDGAGVGIDAATSLQPCMTEALAFTRRWVYECRPIDGKIMFGKLHPSPARGGEVKCDGSML